MFSDLFMHAVIAYLLAAKDVSFFLKSALEASTFFFFIFLFSFFVPEPRVRESGGMIGSGVFEWETSVTLILCTLTRENILAESGYVCLALVPSPARLTRYNIKTRC